MMMPFPAAFVAAVKEYDAVKWRLSDQGRVLDSLRQLLAAMQQYVLCLRCCGSGSTKPPEGWEHECAKCDASIASMIALLDSEDVDGMSPGIISLHVSPALGMMGGVMSAPPLTAPAPPAASLQLGKVTGVVEGSAAAAAADQVAAAALPTQYEHRLVTFSPCISRQALVDGGAGLDAITDKLCETLAGDSVMVGSMLGYKLGGQQGTELDEGVVLLQAALRAGFGYVTISGGRVVLLHNVHRATLFLKPETLHCSPGPRKKISAKRRDVARQVRNQKKEKTLSLRLNTDFDGAVAKLREHHKSSCWLTPQLEMCWLLMMTEGKMHIFELWYGESLIAADFGHPVGASFYVATRFFDPKYRFMQPGFVLAFAEAQVLANLGFMFWDLGGTDSSPMMSYKASLGYVVSRPYFQSEFRRKRDSLTSPMPPAGVLVADVGEEALLTV
jgi:hypothetical protein